MRWYGHIKKQEYSTVEIVESIREKDVRDRGVEKQKLFINEINNNNWFEYTSNLTFHKTQ